MRVAAASPVPAPRRLLREEAMDAVRADIVQGRLAPGTRMTERQICEAHGVSRTIAREIARQLETERLVEVEPHKGLRVARLDPKTVAEIFEIREELEVLVVRAFIAAAGDDELAALRARFDRLMDHARKDERVAIAEETTAFTRFMIEVADHSVAGEILGQLHARINRLRLLSLSRPGRMEASVLEFSDLVDRICARDADGAALAVRMNVRGARASALLQLGQAVAV